MKLKKTHKTVSLLLCIYMLASCAPAIPRETVIPQTTSSLFENDDVTATKSIDDIAYESDGLPAVYITTADGKQVTSKDVYSDCTFRIELNDIYAELESTYTDENGGGAQIHCRGNSSYSRDEMRKKNKYSYKLKLDTKADLFGLGESKHWYLISNWFDVSALRNKLAYDFSGALGLSYTENTWVELYYNGEYRGLYLLTESLEIAEGRVETIDWEEFGEDVAAAYAADNGLSVNDAKWLTTVMQNDLGWITKGSLTASLSNGTTRIDLTPYFDPETVDITSGYLIEYDGRLDGDRTKWSTANKIPVTLKSPAKLSTNTAMYKYVHTLIQDFENALFSPSFYNAKGKHYSEYVDVDSLVDYWLVWTLFNNSEFGYLSMYYYIDGGKIHFGPCWDFDFASGNIVTLPEKWVGYSQWTTDRGGGWFKEILGDPYFSTLCQERWFEISELVDELLRSLDIYYDYMGEAAERCSTRNGTRKNWYLSAVNGGHSYDFEADFENLKTWLYNRVKWLNTQFAIPDPKIDNSANTRSAKLTATVAVNGKALNTSAYDLYGINADLVISPNTIGEMTVTLSNTHTTAISCSLYLNGAEFIGSSPLSTKNAVTFTLDASKLDLTEGAVNVLYLPTFKTDGTLRAMTSVLIRVSAYADAGADECTVKCGDTLYTVKSGEAFIFPEITKTRDGFVAEGWTDGETLYLPGEKLETDEPLAFYVRYKRTEIFSAMDMAK